VRVWADPEEGGGEAKQVAEVQLGTPDAEYGIPARVPGRDTVYALDGALAEHVPVSLEAFHERFVGEEEKPEPASEPVEGEAEGPEE
jgi:hypothetical protein